MNSTGDMFLWQPHVCQCCLTQGCYKELSSEYFYMGEKEIYEEMLFSVFNITITPEQREQRICEACIQKLRDGCSFKRQVLRSQHTLAQKGVADKAKVESGAQESEVKLELELVPDDDGHFDDGELFEDAAPCSDVKLEVSALPAACAGAPAATRRSGAGAGPTRKGREKKSKGTRQDKEVIARTEQSQKLTNKPPRSLEQFHHEKNLKIDTTHLMKNSNLCAFKWHTNKYQCFCCKTTFTDIDDLKTHASHHSWAEVMNRILRNNAVQYHKVEITGLACKLCSEPQETISKLKQHLTLHKINFKEEKDLLIPFVIKKDVFQCAECQKTFVTFPSLNIHMNKHFQNHICETCGAAFIHDSNLREHRHRHENKKYSCEKCNTEFDSLYKRQLHDASVHKTNGSRLCPHCPEKFHCHYNRLLHLIKHHGYKKPEFKCQSCDRVFLRQYLLNSHVRKFHMKEKNHGCTVCAAKFFTKYDLKQHLGTHGGAAAHVCALCGKSYARKSSLKCHAKVHSGMV